MQFRNEGMTKRFSTLRAKMPGKGSRARASVPENSSE